MCVSPIHKFNRETGLVESYSCGKCIECVKRYQRDWSFRLSREYHSWKHAYFLTLTYSDDTVSYVEFPFDTDSDEAKYCEHWLSRLPKTLHLKRRLESLDDSSIYLNPDNICRSIPVPTCNKSDVTKWLKVIRERFYREHGFRPIFKYFLCSEYGPATLRPHYHMILFSDFDVRTVAKFFVQTWKEFYGNVYWKFRPIIWNSEYGVDNAMAYVAKYCCKPAELESCYVRLGVVEKPFRIMSKGIGYNYFPTILSKCIENTKGKKYCSPEWLESFDASLYYCVNGYKFRYPRFYIDKLFPQKWYASQSWCSAKQQYIDVWCKRKNPKSYMALAYKGFMAEKFIKLQQEQLQSLAGTGLEIENLEIVDKAEAYLLYLSRADYKEKARRLYSNYSDSFKFDL